MRGSVVSGKWIVSGFGLFLLSEAIPIVVFGRIGIWYISLGHGYDVCPSLLKIMSVIQVYFVILFSSIVALSLILHSVLIIIGTLILRVRVPSWVS